MSSRNAARHPVPKHGAARSLLIVDQDLGFAERLGRMLEPIGIAAVCADTPERGFAALRNPPRGREATPVALIDVHFGRLGGGVDLIPRLRAKHPELICVLMTAGIDAETAIEALRGGTYDCLDKAAGSGALHAVLDRCYDRVALQREREAAYEALRAAKEEAEAASRGKSGFLATMSHELRTPLNAIIGFSEMMMHEVLGELGNERYRAYVADIHASGTHLLQIINDILDLSKAEAGKLELHEDVFDIRETIRSVRKLIAARMSDAAPSCTVALPNDLPLLLADERKIKQVLLNLVCNAVKFTPAGGRVEIAARNGRDAGLTVTVLDTGIGVARHDLPRILLPFEQVDTKFSREHEGTGLGLPLVKAIMELHGGGLDLSSEIGAGTEVTITFPPSRVVLRPEPRTSRDAA